MLTIISGLTSDTRIRIIFATNIDAPAICTLTLAMVQKIYLPERVHRVLVTSGIHRIALARDCSCSILVVYISKWSSLICII